jgi:cell wall-associated NlpC family hydrolase
VAIANHERRAALASARHHDGASYAHRIRPEAESPSASNDVVRSAFAYRGTPYRWGESRPGGFDCSGFTKYIYGRKGVTLPRTAAEQYHAGHAVAHKGMKPGDLVFFHTTRSGISHVGMYVGNGKFVHSSSKGSGGVRVDNLESGYYSKAFRGARRVRKETTESSGE